MERWWNDTDRGEWSVGGMMLTGDYSSTGRITWHSATVCTTNCTCTYPVSNQDPRGERRATDRLSYGRAL